ncbi:Tripartite-type tricarboxylate transporter, receptor component TctC [Polaromonas sp. OV174]|uniref:Bug family tripartite tricarboxylate transporter substrate binding protein n=1 Tax=Polaromonas sp. OV174 TaxID=1855300 RepID=UPI0008E5E0DF|nr:tripartite tricarboxylate transporter substrate binding protein [Polaromonas sp. OV174]SFC58199.1 Tripartite-type tricarboxylate transporter, receptor component TctC [Polaromonas sp. OV174]
MSRFNLSRRAALCTAAVALSGLSLTAMAQDKRPLEWVVGMSAGGGTDIVARTVADQMGKTLNQTIVVVNKPGAAHNIAADYVARSSTPANLLLTGDYAVLATNPWLYSKLSYNADRDLSSVGMLVRFPLILVVSPKLPVKNFKEFVAWAKAQPGGANYASPGAGAPHHLAMELLRQRTGLNMTHVPYRGVTPAIQDIMGGQVPFMFVESAGGMPNIVGGNLRAIGVASAKRMDTLPEVPTLMEQGLKDFEAFAWQGLSVHSSTPPAEIQRLNNALQAALNSTPVKARFQALGVEAMPGTPEQMNTFAKAERERWGKLIKEIGLKID